jgi:putative addiction module component (TIGR02574 family)
MPASLSELLKLPAGERAELAMALWESLSEAAREGELDLTAEQAAELERRWTEHVQRPESSTPWDDVRRRLMERE